MTHKINLGANSPAPTSMPAAPGEIVQFDNHTDEDVWVIFTKGRSPFVNGAKRINLNIAGTDQEKIDPSATGTYQYIYPGRQAAEGIEGSDDGGGGRGGNIVIRE